MADQTAPAAEAPPLRIIGAGLGRTGTASLRLALNDLGVPCYHMFDLGFGPTRVQEVAFWNEVADGAAPPWDRVFHRWGAVLDYPACFFWKELMAAYPDAKVVLTTHPKGSGAWYDSTAATIHAEPEAKNASAYGLEFNRMMERLVWTGVFGGQFDDREATIATYEAHNQAVRDGVPAERLVDYQVNQGWGPICAALDIPVPDRPFPNSNSRSEMGRRMEILEKMKRFDLSRRGT